MTLATTPGKPHLATCGNVKSVHVAQISTATDSFSSNIYSPQLALPVELKLEIFSYLQKSRVMVIILRKTHRSFRAILPKYDQRVFNAHFYEQDHISPRIVFYRQLNFAEFFSKATGIELFPPGHFPCYTCFQILPVQAFTDKAMREPAVVRGRCYYTRFCVGCGMQGREIVRRRSDLSTYTIHEPPSFRNCFPFKLNGSWHAIYQCWALIDYTRHMSKEELE